RWVEPRLYEKAKTAAFETRLNAKLGPDGRLWMYYHTLPMMKALAPWALAAVPRSEQTAFAIGGRPRGPKPARYPHGDAPAAAPALARSGGVFDEIAKRLADGRPFLLDERFSAADLTFAALTAPLIMPAQYGSPLPPVDTLPEAITCEVRRLRD